MTSYILYTLYQIHLVDEEIFFCGCRLVSERSFTCPCLFWLPYGDLLQHNITMFDVSTCIYHSFHLPIQVLSYSLMYTIHNHWGIHCLGAFLGPVFSIHLHQYVSFHNQQYTLLRLLFLVWSSINFTPYSVCRASILVSTVDKLSFFQLVKLGAEVSSRTLFTQYAFQCFPANIMIIILLISIYLGGDTSVFVLKWLFLSS